MLSGFCIFCTFLLCDCAAKNVFFFKKLVLMLQVFFIVLIEAVQFVSDILCSNNSS